MANAEVLKESDYRGSLRMKAFPRSVSSLMLCTTSQTTYANQSATARRFPLEHANRSATDRHLPFGQLLDGDPVRASKMLGHGVAGAHGELAILGAQPASSLGHTSFCKDCDPGRALVQHTKAEVHRCRSLGLLHRAVAHLIEVTRAAMARKVRVQLARDAQAGREHSFVTAWVPPHNAECEHLVTCSPPNTACSCAMKLGPRKACKTSY